MKKFIHLLIQLFGIVQLFASLIELSYDYYIFSIITYLFGVFCLIYPLPKKKKLYFSVALVSVPFSLFMTGMLLDFLNEIGVRIPFIIELILFVMIPFIISYSFIILTRKNDS